ncbi:MAG TPA: c-type cytochrome [Xanthomonadales bacterium]|nr:c-type cytochrome [Xanthomonadales bacterium]
MRRSTSILLAVGVLGLVVLGAVVAYDAAKAQRTLRERAEAVAGGNVDRGRAAIERFGCGACHAIPGLAGPHGLVGPPLAGVGERAYVAGRLRNTPSNLARWIAHPQAVEPGNAMPDLGVSEAQARDIVAYLYAQ